MSNTNKLPTVHYLSLRSYPKFEKEKRRNPPSAQKVDYIIDSLNSLGYHVNYVSFSESLNDKLCRAKKMKLSEMTDFYLCPNIPGKYRESFTYRWFKHIYAPKHIKYGDILLVYHTNGMRNVTLRAIADKYEMQFVYEVEEIFAYVHEQINEKQVNEEIEFLQCPDKYLFVTDTLAKIVNKQNKPFITIEGYFKYSVKANSSRFDNGKIHCVYGGIVDSVKGGAFSIVDACKYLPQNYYVHILGYGDTGRLRKEIENSEKERVCELRYEGLKNGDEYIDFISKCHIGLCIQSMKDYNTVSFPSKLVLYLACGLRTVACNVDAIANSRMAGLIAFYDEDTPEAIADAVMSIDVDAPYDSKLLMDSLDRGFKKDLKQLLEK